MEDPAWSVSKFVVGIDGGAQLEARRVYVHGAVGYGHPPLCSAAQSEGPGAPPGPQLLLGWIAATAGLGLSALVLAAIIVVIMLMSIIIIQGRTSS